LLKTTTYFQSNTGTLEIHEKPFIKPMVKMKAARPSKTLVSYHNTIQCHKS